MRIAHLITRMIIGGAQENTLFCCRDLIEQYQDDVLLITGPALGPEGDLLSTDATAQAVPTLYVDSLRRSIHPWRDLSAYRAIRAALIQFKPDVVHTHSAKAGFLGRLAAHRLKIPVVVHTVHGAPFHPYQHFVPRTLFTGCERFAARRCHRLISVADAMTDLLVEAQVADRDHCTTIYSGMDIEPFLDAEHHRVTTRAELGLEPQHIVIGKIARLFHLKGHDDLITAAAGVIKACPNVRFLLIGDGILRDSIEQRLQDQGLSEHFLLTGLVPPQQIPKLIGAMDGLVHVSLREGLARALPQALIASKPVISYDVDGAREVVLPEITGLLVPPRDVVQLEQSLIRLAFDADVRTKWGQEGCRRFSDQFRHQQMTSEIRQLYLKIAGDSLGNSN